MKIITHPGQAHADDLLSVAFLMHRLGTMTEVHRRNPTDGELDDPNCIVVDVGGRHEPAKMNFDHHQFAADARPTCAFSLVLQHWKMYESYQAAFPWLAATELLDSKGPFAAAAKIGAKGDDLLPFLMSPMAGFLLSRFEAGEVVSGETRLLLYDFGDYIDSRLAELRQAWAKLEKTSSIYEIDGVEVFDAGIQGSAGVESFLKKNGQDPAVVVTKDDRGPGEALFRRNDDPRIDFSKVEGQEGIIFAHKNGFVAKTEQGVSAPEIIRKSLVA